MNAIATTPATAVSKFASLLAAVTTTLALLGGVAVVAQHEADSAAPLGAQLAAAKAQRAG